MKISFNYVKQYFDSIGVELLSTEYISAKSKLKFKCVQCGGVGEVQWQHIKLKGGNKENFICRDCRLITKEKIEKEFEAANLKVVNIEYAGAKSKIYYRCKKCNNVLSVSYSNFKWGTYKQECENCRWRELVEKKGSQLISVNKENLRVKCAECGKEFEVQKKLFSQSNFICKDCTYGHTKFLVEIQEEAKKAGAEILSKSFINRRSRIYFKCSKCGKKHYTTKDSFESGVNKDFLCLTCQKGNLVKYNGNYGSKTKRHRVDALWFNAVKDFFSIKDRKAYGAHHIIPFAKDPLYRTSIVNGYPLSKELHSRGCKTKDGLDPFHRNEKYLNPENWLQEAKLFYHNYNDFHFLNLNEVMVTQILDPSKEYYSGELLKKKKELAEKGQLYIPIFFEEVFDSTKWNIVMSMLKSKLYRYYKDIWQYTGTNFRKVYGRNLDVRFISNKEAEDFENTNHIQGFVRASQTVGGFHKKTGELLIVMSFGNPRQRIYRDGKTVEIYRLCSKINTEVIGGPSKLLKFYINNASIKRIMTYLDLRWAELDPEKAIYSKLGFKYIGMSKPNYFYSDVEYNRIYNRYQFQKRLLRNKLLEFDENLSEYCNMVKAGFIRQYDCGNYKYILEI